MSWIDVHTHLHMIKKDLNEVIKACVDQDVCHLITIGTVQEDWPCVLKHLKQNFKGVHVYGALGCHPHSAKNFTDEAEEELRKNLKEEKIVALGEIGLDDYYENSELEVQKEVFRKQMQIAQENGLNVEIHTRSAEEDTLEVLSEFKGKVRGLLHCFTGSWKMAKKALDMGYNISFSGIVTFKKAQDLKEVCEKVPLNRLHIETDAPYLAPIPYRGKENQPAYLTQTAQTVCTIHQIELEQLKLQTQKNAVELFPKITSLSSNF